MNQDKSVKQALTGASQLTASDSPRLDCQLLLAHVLNKNRTWLIAHDDYLLTPRQWQAYQQLLADRQAGKPVAYLIGHQEFWSLPFQVNEHTLVPRPETELLVETILELKPNPKATIVDLGTGSGAIAIALATELPLVNIMATDKSLEALKMAQKNSQQLCHGRVKLMLANWLAPFPEHYFDIIVSNPPYIAPEDEHLNHLGAEPISALMAQDQGLLDLKLIIRGARFCLKPNGLILLEHGYQQQSQVQALLAQSGYTGIKALTDLAGQARAVLAYSP